MERDGIKESEMHPQDLSDDYEIKNNSETNENIINYYVQKLKLAVAIAVIRTTPLGTTPENHALSLVRNFNKDIDSWREKCEVLEKEMLMLEQKLHTVTLKEKFNIPDSDMDVNDDISLKQAVVPSSPQSRYLSYKISNTIEFVKSFILLGSLSHGNLANTETERTKNSFRDTVVKSVALLFEHLRCEDGLVLEFEITKRAIVEVHKLLDSRANFFEEDIMKLINEFVESLLRDIYKTVEMNKVNYQHRRSAIIQLLAEHERLTPLLLGRLLREVAILSDIISTHFRPEVEDFSSLLQVENAYYIFQATEGTIYTMRQHKGLNAFKIRESLLLEWDKTTEKSLLEISFYLPMYSFYVWHLKALLKSVLESNMDI